MKYGQTLQQRSIPEWGPYNIDYDDLKRLIKIRTTSGRRKAVPIPGQSKDGDDSQQAFEDELYDELVEQYQRIDLFVQSKAGEIQRRLDHLRKQIVHLGRRELPADRKHISVKKLEKFSRAEEDVLKVGEDIQALARFVGAQRLAFRKLLKKYKKWTGSPSLQQRFTKVLDQPNSFSKRDFQPLLGQWTDVLATVREPFKNRISFKEGYGERPGQHCSEPAQVNSVEASRSQGVSTGASNSPEEASSFKPLLDAQHTCLLRNRGTAQDFDVAFSTVPRSGNGGKMAYWVHEDNLIELQILLLQYTRLRSGWVSSARTDDTSARTPSGRNTVDKSPNIPFEEETDETNHVTFLTYDDQKEGARHIHNLANGSDEVVLNEALLERTASIRWGSGRDGCLVIKKHPGDSKSDVNHPRSLKLDSKELPAFFDSNRPFRPTRRPPGSKSDILQSVTPSSSAREAEAIRETVLTQKAVLPLSHIRTNRTRFVGLGNTSSEGTWAVLDKQVTMAKADLTCLSQARTQTAFESGVIFPHGVLDIRWESLVVPDLVRALDRSHLVEKIPGFSLEAHANAVLYKKHVEKIPAWIELLARDIRKVPPTRHPQPRRSRAVPSSSESAQSRTPSTAPTSVTDGQRCEETPRKADGSQGPDVLEQANPVMRHGSRQKRKKCRDYSSRGHTVRPSGLSEERYWNEYDDGEERSEDSPYTIFVDPNASFILPGQDLVFSFASAALEKTSAARRTIRIWFGQSERADERRPLVPDYFNQHPECGNHDIEDDASSGDNTHQNPPGYGTLPLCSRRPRSRIPSERTYPLVAHAGFLTSAVSVLLLGAWFIVADLADEDFMVHYGPLILAAVEVVSLSCALAGVGLTFSAGVCRSWVHRVAVLTVFGFICIGNGVLLALVFA